MTFPRTPLYALNRFDWTNALRRLPSSSWAPPPPWHWHMTLCTRRWLWMSRGWKLPRTRDRKEGRSLINDHMLWEISSRLIRRLNMERTHWSRVVSQRNDNKRVDGTKVTKKNQLYNYSLVFCNTTFTECLKLTILSQTEAIFAFCSFSLAVNL